jgi:hypothetical protein
MHTSPNDLYEVKGLLGKGLGLKKEGTHVAFVGGTGVLVFMDLIALILRQNLGLLKEKSFLNMSLFKFVLYASFPSRKDAIALELLEGLSNVTKTLGLNNFHLELRFSNENRISRNNRWDRDFILRNI